jgi:methylmalonyl-CoA mutase N-terminal domain/subunit
MYRAAETGVVQEMLGGSALEWQRKVESGEQIVVGVNAHQKDNGAPGRPPAQERPDPERIKNYLAEFAAYKAGRDQSAVQSALDNLARACNDETQNTYDRTVNAAIAGATHGEICGTVRREMGAGNPLVVA